MNMRKTGVKLLIRIGLTNHGFSTSTSKTQIYTIFMNTTHSLLDMSRFYMHMLFVVINFLIFHEDILTNIPSHFISHMHNLFLLICKLLSPNQLFRFLICLWNFYFTYIRVKHSYNNFFIQLDDFICIFLKEKTTYFFDDG